MKISITLPQPEKTRLAEIAERVKLKSTDIARIGLGRVCDEYKEFGELSLTPLTEEIAVGTGPEPFQMVLANSLEADVERLIADLGLSCSDLVRNGLSRVFDEFNQTGKITIRPRWKPDLVPV